MRLICTSCVGRFIRIRMMYTSKKPVISTIEGHPPGVPLLIWRHRTRPNFDLWRLFSPAVYFPSPESKALTRSNERSHATQKAPAIISGGIFVFQGDGSQRFAPRYMYGFVPCPGNRGPIKYLILKL